MALFHAATLTPTKAELIADWVPSQSWGPSAEEPIEVIGAFRFDDPEGRIGIETHIVRAGGALFQVPLTYRDAPMDGCDDSLVTTMVHSALGKRWVYDAIVDECYLLTLAGFALTGQGEALGFVEIDGRWSIVPAAVRIHGGGWTQGPVSIDRLEKRSHDNSKVIFQNDRIGLTFFRELSEGSQPAIGMTATWDGQSGPVLLAEVTKP